VCREHRCFLLLVLFGVCYAKECVFWCSRVVVWGVGVYEEGEGTLGVYSTKFHTGRLCPEVQPLTLLNSIFDRKGLT